jgi:hypothetical protein
MSFCVNTRNGPDQEVAYPEGEYPTLEAAEDAARYLRRTYPFSSEEVTAGWFTSIAVVEIQGIVSGPCLSHS